MFTRYRLTVVACALSWFMVGLHMPAIHEVTHHGRAVSWSVLTVVLVLAIAAVAALAALLRHPRFMSDDSPGSPGHQTRTHNSAKLS